VRDADFQLPERGDISGTDAPDDALVYEVFRHSYGPRHRLRTDIAVDDDGNVVARGATFGMFVRDLVVIVAIALVVSIVVKTFFLKPFYIPSASMHETLIEEDRVLVNQLVPDLVALNRGDVIVFEDPGGWLPQQEVEQKEPLEAAVDGALELIGLKPEETNSHLIKRVIGLPGDHVVCCNAYGQIVINDVPISEPYVELGDNTAASGTAFDVTVPEGAVWVMGDNRYNSADSRAHQDTPTGGFIPYENIVGRAFLINWPVARIQFLGNYPEVFAGIPSRDP
jgi:signal peptidase I